MPTPVTLVTESTTAINAAIAAAQAAAIATAASANKSADTIIDGTTNKAYTATEKTKLATVATGATANDTDANLKNRANHTGTQLSSTISDMTEAVQDIIGASILAGTNVTVVYNDASNTFTISATGGSGGGTLDTETVQDIIGALISGTGLITATYNDVANTLVISTTATANQTDTYLRSRVNHTGTQSADTIVDGTTNKVYTAAEKTQLAALAAGGSGGGTGTGAQELIVLEALDDPTAVDTGLLILQHADTDDIIDPNSGSADEMIYYYDSTNLVYTPRQTTRNVFEGTPDPSLTVNVADGDKWSHKGVGMYIRESGLWAAYYGGTASAPAANPVAIVWNGPYSYTQNVAITSFSFTATGGTTLTWSITSGTLPTGLSMTSAGLVSGTPTVVTTGNTITLKVTSADGSTDTMSLKFIVTAAAGGGGGSTSTRYSQLGYWNEGGGLNNFTATESSDPGWGGHLVYGGTAIMGAIGKKSDGSGWLEFGYVNGGAGTNCPTDWRNSAGGAACSGFGLLPWFDWTPTLANVSNILSGAQDANIDACANNMIAGGVLTVGHEPNAHDKYGDQTLASSGTTFCNLYNYVAGRWAARRTATGIQFKIAPVFVLRNITSNYKYAKDLTPSLVDFWGIDAYDNIAFSPSDTGNQQLSQFAPKFVGYLRAMYGGNTKQVGFRELGTHPTRTDGYTRPQWLVNALKYVYSTNTTATPSPTINFGKPPWDLSTTEWASVKSLMNSGY